MEFIASYDARMESLAPKENGKSPAPAELNPPDDIQRATLGEQQAWQAVQRCIDSAAAWKAWREARRDRIQCQLDANQLIPFARVDAIRTEFLQPLVQLLKTAPQIVGPEANPQNPQQGIEAMRNFLRVRLRPVIEALAQQLPSQVPVEVEPSE